MFYKKDRGFTPLEIPKLLKSYAKFLTGFTLIELLIVIIIIGILAGIALPQFAKTKEHALGKEAIANLKLIAAAEKIYKMEMGSYYPAVGETKEVTDINTDLKLSLTATNWKYSIMGCFEDPLGFAAYADRKNGPYSDCVYTINKAVDEPVVSSGTCP